eukprot:6746-Pelagomonas_calceolata.AAC.1
MLPPACFLRPISSSASLALKSRVACDYNTVLVTDGKCVRMITPKRFGVLFKAFHRSKEEGLHDGICPPPARFPSEILGLLLGASSPQKQIGRQIPKQKDNRFLLMDPPTSHSLCQKWAQVTQEKIASPLDYNTQYHQYWSSDPRDILFGAHYNCIFFYKVKSHAGIAGNQCADQVAKYQASLKH